MLIEHDELRRHWYVVAEDADLDASGSAGPVPVSRTLLGRRLVLWRDPVGAVVAAPDRCPHREAPLSAGRLDHGCLVCPYHGWRFGDAGRCVEIPSSGADRAVPPGAHLPTVHVQVRHGLVWVCLADEPAGTVPAMAAEDDPAYRRINTGVDTWAVSATRMTDNFLDIAHFPYIHVGTIGRPDQAEVPRLELEPLDDGYHGYRYTVDVANAGGAAASGMTEGVVTREMSTGFHLPFTVRSTIRYETGLDHLILLCSTPVDDVTSYFTFVVWRNDVDDPDLPADPEETIAFDRAIGAEDKSMLELIPGVLPLDHRDTVSVRADTPSVEWRRRLASLLGTDAAD